MPPSHHNFSSTIAPHNQKESLSSWLLPEEGRREMLHVSNVLTFRGAAWWSGSVLPESEHWEESAPRGGHWEQRWWFGPTHTRCPATIPRISIVQVGKTPKFWFLPETEKNWCISLTFQAFRCYSREHRGFCVKDSSLGINQVRKENDKNTTKLPLVLSPTKQPSWVTLNRKPKYKRQTQVHGDSNQLLSQLTKQYLIQRTETKTVILKIKVL